MVIVNNSRGKDFRRRSSTFAEANLINKQGIVREDLIRMT